MPPPSPPAAPSGPLRYDAFISYRHVDPDRAWAKWLHAALETYRVPKELVRQGFPARLGRVFRDEEELPANADLSSQITQALEQSRFLIVICSPRAPQSRWVNAEIEHFRTLGRHDRILALLIEGEPRAAFPSALTEIRRTITDAATGQSREQIEEIEPLAADVRPDRTDAKAHTLRSHARLRLLACILGCRFDDLRQRDAERRARRLRRIGVGLGVLAVVLAGLTTFAFLQKAEANRQRDAAERRRQIAQGFGDFLTQDILLAATPEDEGVSVSMVDVLKTASVRAAARRDLPEVEAEVRLAIGQAFDRLGLLPEAQSHLERAIALRTQQRSLVGEEGVEDAQLILANVLCRQDKADESVALARSVANARSARLGPDHDLTLTARNDLGNTLKYLDRLDEAEAEYADALKRRRSAFSADHRETLIVQFNLGLLRIRQANAARPADPAKADALLADGVSLMADAADRRERTLGPEHPDTLFAQSELAALLHRSKRLDQAEPIYRKLQPAMDRVLSPGSWRALQNKANLAVLLRDTDRVAEGLPLLRDAALGYRTARGAAHEQTVAIGAAYARLEAKVGDPAAAIRFAAETYDALAGALGPNAPRAKTQADLVLKLLEPLADREAERETWRARAAGQ